MACCYKKINQLKDSSSESASRRAASHQLYSFTSTVKYFIHRKINIAQKIFRQNVPFFFFFACTEYLPLNWARTCVWDGDSTCPPAPSCSPCPGLEAGPGRRPAACRSAGRYSAPGIAPRTSDSAAAETLAPTPPWSPWGAEAPTFHSPTPLTALRFLPRHRLTLYRFVTRTDSSFTDRSNRRRSEPDWTRNSPSQGFIIIACFRL